MRGLRAALIVFIAVLLQSSLGEMVEVFGAHPDFVLVTGIVAGIAAGPEMGAVVGFAAGLVLDLLLPTPVGMSALCYCLMGYAAGLVQLSVIRSVRWIPVATVAALSIAGTLLFFVLCKVLSQPVPRLTHVPTIVAMVTVVNTLLCLPLLWLFRLALAEPEPSARDRLSLR